MRERWEAVYGEFRIVHTDAGGCLETREETRKFDRNIMERRYRFAQSELLNISSRANQKLYVNCLRVS